VKLGEIKKRGPIVMVGIPPNSKLQYKDEGTLVPERKSVPVAKLLYLI
jgi:hypothetical protein